MLAPKLSRFAAVQTRTYASTASRPPLTSLAALARPKAEQISREWKGTNASGEVTKAFIGGEFVESSSNQYTDVVDPVYVL